MLSINFRKNLLLTKHSPFQIQLNKYNKIIFKNLFYLKETETFKAVARLNQIPNAKTKLNKITIKSFSNKIETNFIENFNFESQKEKTISSNNSSNNKNPIYKNNIYNSSHKKTNQNQNNIYNSDYLEDNNEKDSYSNDLEKRLDNLFKRVSKKDFDYEKNLEQKANEKVDQDIVAENNTERNLDNFKKYISSTLFIPKTDFNERLNVKETELKQINKITEDYYIEQLGIFNDPQKLRINSAETNNKTFDIASSVNSDLEKLNSNNNSSSKSSINFNYNNKNKLWITHDIPSASTGKPHFSQIMNKVIKDAINRIKNLQGYRVIYKPGFECYGVNLENYVFSKINKKKFNTLQEMLDHKFNELTNQMTEEDRAKSDEIQSFNLNRTKASFFREQCREYIEEYILEQKEYYKRMGIMTYYNHAYKTFEKSYEKKQIDFFQDLYERGLIFRDYRKIFWSENAQKIVDLEDIEEKTEMGDALIIKFPITELSNDLKEIQKLFPNKSFCFLGFATEAYKYIGIQALSINDNADYCIAELSEESKDLVICAYKRLPEICKRANFLKTFKVHFVAKGWAFKNLIARDPIFSRKLPLISNENVSVFFGTGINLICPAHDSYKTEEENGFARKYNLSIQGFLDEHNNFCRSLGLYFYNTNCFVNGNKKIISKLNNLKSVFLSFKYENAFYASKKTGERITVRTIASWFLKIDETLKNECLKELSFVSFHPELNFEELKDKNNINKMKELKKIKYTPRKKKILDSKEDLKDYFNVIEELDTINEWCISEVNIWGLPVPHFVDLETKEILINSEIIYYVKNLFNEHGSDIWYNWEVKDLLPEKYKKDSDKYTTGKDSFDYIFNSALSFFGLENFTAQEKEVLESLENFRNLDYIRELNTEFNSIKYSVDHKNRRNKLNNTQEETEYKVINNDADNSEKASDFEADKHNMNSHSSETDSNSNFEKDLFKSENLNLDVNMAGNQRKKKTASTESEREYTDLSTGSGNEHLNKKKNREIDDNKENLIASSENENKENKENNNTEDEFSGESLYEYISNNPNFDKIKEIIPEPILLEHLATKTKSLISLQNNNFSIKTNHNKEGSEDISSLKLNIFNMKKNAESNNENKSNICVYDMIIEGKNQHSLWLLFSCLASVSHHNFNIYKSVLTHGYILDSSGKEISEKNFKDALDIVDGTIKRFSGREYGNGADSLRLYFLKHSMDLDYKLFEEDILKAKNDIKFYRKVAKACLGLLADYDLVKIEKNLIQKIKVNLDELDILDQIVFYEFVKYYEEANRLIQDYNIADLSKKTFEFLKKVFNDYYLDSAKFVIINYKKNDFRRLIKQFILKEVLFNVSKILYPMIPFNTEDVYSHMYFLTAKKAYLGLEEFSELSEIKAKLNFNLTDFQRVNYEFKSKNILQIKNKFLHIFHTIVEKANVKNKLNESAYWNQYNENDFDNYNPLAENEKYDVNDLSQVENKIKSLEDKNNNKLKVNLIENDPYSNKNNNKEGLVVYGNDLLISDLALSNQAGKGYFYYNINYF